LKKSSIEISYQQFVLSDLSNEELTLREVAFAASKKAYAPYSTFYVGASVLLSTGIIIPGNNQENAAFPSGLCAERVALFHAGSLHPGIPVKAIGITIDYERCPQVDMAYPCGGCRQVMAEYELISERPIHIYLFGNREQGIRIEGVTNLLPFSFMGNFLQK